MIRIGLGAAAAAALALPVGAGAQTQSRVSADVSAIAGYSNNPFTSAGGDTGAAVATVDVAPRFQLLTPHSTVTVSADANFEQYLSRYGHNDSYSGALDYKVRPSARVTAHAHLDLSSSVLGAFNSNLPLAANTTAFAPTVAAPADPATAGSGTTGTVAAIVPAEQLPIASPLVPYTDVGLFGLRNRRRTGQASGDLSFVLSARDTLSVGGYGQVTRYSNLNTSNYETYGGSAGFQHSVSSRLRVGLTGSATTTNYHAGLSDSRIYSIQATAAGQLNERWSADGALGVSFVSGDTTRSTRSTSLSGDVDLCRRGPHSSLCLQAARSVSPTGFAGSQYVTSAGLSWTRQLDERQNVSLGGSYSKVGGTQAATGPTIPGGLVLQNEYAQATAGYYLRLRARLGLVASVNYRQLLDDNNGRSADYGGQLGLSYRFGDRR